MLNFDYDYHLQMDGSKAGYRGYPYLLNSLLKLHNQTDKFEVINLSNDNFTVIAGPDYGKTYKDTCEYKQLLQSDPDIVISMIGGKESLNVNAFTPEAFTQGYSAFLKEMKSLPSKPEIMILTPAYSSASLIPHLNQTLYSH